MNARGEIARELHLGQDPYEGHRGKEGDEGYPHTNIDETCIRAVANRCKPRFWLEVGSMLGGSAIKTARVLSSMGSDCGVVCVDPFCGDVNMWCWERDLAFRGEWRFLSLNRGVPTIKERFLANVCNARLEGQICPITATSMVGMKTIERLHREGRISHMPDVVYLDSAHEEGETLVELRTAWRITRPGGVLFGDDWAWEGVRNDVFRFANEIKVDLAGTMAMKSELLEGNIEGNGILVARGHWFLIKPFD